MGRIAFVNGRYLPHGRAAVHIEDRGYQFSDGVYEVVPVYRGRLVDEELHLDRLDRSLAELRIPQPMSRAALRLVSAEMLRRNHLTNGFLYMQVTRGVAARDHKFPKDPQPSLVMTAQQKPPQPASLVESGVKVITLPDIRWRRRDIKSISLLPNCLAKQQAHESGAFEAWMVEADGTVTEGSSTNAWIVTAEGRLLTRNAGEAILNGITRLSLLKCAAEEGIGFEERPFTLKEARQAREAFLTSSSNFLLPVVEIDGKAIGDGRPGPLTRRLRAAYLAHATGQGTRGAAAR